MYLKNAQITEIYEINVNYVVHKEPFSSEASE